MLAPVEKSRLTVYQAETDGFVFAFILCPGTPVETLIKMDSTTPPTQIRQKDSAAEYGTNSAGSLGLPVPKGWYWKEEDNYDVGIWWIPLK